MIVALVALSALFHATWNALLRLERDKDRSLVVAIFVATLFALAVAVVRGALGSVLFASGRGVAFSAAAGVFEGLYFMTLAKAMARGRLGVVYTVSRGGSVLVVWPLSVALYGEVATGASVAGSLIVLVGLTACGFGGRNAGARGADGADGYDARGALAWAIACAVSIAGYHIAYKASLREATNPSACFALALGVAAVLNLARISAADRRALGPLIRARAPRLLVMGLVCSGSFLILMEALARGGSGFVITLRNISVLFAAGFAWWIGERPGRLELIGALLVAAGAAVMA
ncbi:MAG TPA: EamA family transporter [Kofleriaceae bacterium]|nr:EamA family transporter [Kofleriaceae bacterium]